MASRGKADADSVIAAVQLIAGQTQQIKKIVDEVQEASREQAGGVEQIAGAISQMESVTQRVASTAEQSASAATQLTAQCVTLNGIVSELAVMAGA